MMLVEEKHKCMFVCFLKCALSFKTYNYPTGLFEVFYMDKNVERAQLIKRPHLAKIKASQQISHKSRKQCWLKKIQSIHDEIIF